MATSMAKSMWLHPKPLGVRTVVQGFSMALDKSQGSCLLYFILKSYRGSCAAAHIRFSTLHRSTGQQAVHMRSRATTAHASMPYFTLFSETHNTAQHAIHKRYTSKLSTTVSIPDEVFFDSVLHTHNGTGGAGRRWSASRHSYAGSALSTSCPWRCTSPSPGGACIAATTTVRPPACAARCLRARAAKLAPPPHTLCSTLQP